MIDFPLFCPNPSCRFHSPQGEKPRWRKFGSFKSKLHRGSILQRFQCQACRKTCSKLTFDFEHLHRRRDLTQHVFQMFLRGMANRQIALALSCSEHLVRRRIERLAQQGMLYHSQKYQKLFIKEEVAFDGLENFAKSQFEPNNINHLIGRESLFIYDFGYCPLNRKGRMSETQKITKNRLEIDRGRFHPSAIRLSTIRILRRALEHLPVEGRLYIYSDEHFQYKRAIRCLSAMEQLKVVHDTVSSKAPRTYKNVLFAVNHTDLLTRQHIRAFSRETIAFSKTHGAMMQKYALFSLWKNYFRPKFTKKHKRDPLANVQTPAQAIGVETRRLRYGDVFTKRLFRKHFKLSKEWSLFFSRRVPLGRSKRFLPQHGPAHKEC